MITEVQVTGLFNGISRQPNHLRHPSQCQELINGIPDVARGVYSRKATKELARIPEWLVLNYGETVTAVDAIEWTPSTEEQILAIITKTNYSAVPPAGDNQIWGWQSYQLSLLNLMEDTATLIGSEDITYRLTGYPGAVEDEREYYNYMDGYNPFVPVGTARVGIALSNDNYFSFSDYTTDSVSVTLSVTKWVKMELNLYIEAIGGSAPFYISVSDGTGNTWQTTAYGTGLQTIYNICPSSTEATITITASSDASAITVSSISLKSKASGVISCHDNDRTAQSFTPKLLPLGRSAYVWAPETLVESGTDRTVSWFHMGLPSKPSSFQYKQYAYTVIRDGAIGVSYTTEVTIDGTAYKVVYTSNSNSSASVTQYIVSHMYNVLNAAGVASLYRVGIIEDNVYYDGSWRDCDTGLVTSNPSTGTTFFFQVLNPTASTTLSITYGDSQGGNYGVAYVDAVDYFEQLPSSARTGTVIRINGTASDKDDKYVVFNGSRWINFYDFSDENTALYRMPLRVNVNDDLSTMEIVEESWYPRRSGDSGSNPLPSFVGQGITSMFIWHNRLGILSGDSVVLSEADNLTNFFVPDVSTRVDSDPIDFSLLSTTSDNLLYAIPYQLDILLSSGSRQYRMTANGRAIAAANIQVRATTTKRLAIAPIVGNHTVFLVEDCGDYCHVHEYMAGGDIEDYTVCMTQHAIGYIEMPVSKGRFDTVLNEIILDNYRVRQETKGREIIQQAVYKSTSSCGIIMNGKKYGGRIPTNDFDARIYVEDSLPYCVDQYITDNVIVEADGSVSVTLSQVFAGDYCLIYADEAVYYFTVDGYYDTYEVTTPHDFADRDAVGMAIELIIGLPFDTTLTLSTPVLHNRFNVPLTTGTQKYIATNVTGRYRRANLEFSSTSRGTTTVIPLTRSGRGLTFSFPEESTGTTRVLMNGDINDITVSLTNDSVFPCEFHGVTYELLSHKRATNY